MTDLPRRSYPLVVPPPGGFEDAVRRGRRVRRRRTGGSTGAALVLAGVIAYASIGTPSNTDGLRPTKQTPRQEETQAPYGETASPTPEPTVSPAPTATPDAPPDPTAGPGGPAGPTNAPGTVAPPVDPDPTASARPTREQKPPRTRAYAKRSPIHESEPTIAGSTGCLTEGVTWCATASERGSTIDVPRTYEFVYTLCRAADAGPGVVTFDRFQEVEFAARHVGTNDTVWTYSAGQPIGRPGRPTEVPAGYCVEWTTTWDGYDDYGHTPLDGTYELIASSTGSSDTTLPTQTFEFQHS